MKISNQRMIAVCFFTLPSFNDPTIMNDQALTPCLAVENALKESEERFRQMAEMTGEWLWEQDAKGFYLYSSNAVQQIVGWSPDAVIGTHYTALLTP
ncbi:MAG: PAS domain S-box protein, partial [Methylococcaceae bacterium]|nr:PAS domain S-box protein [Methylococcaceae bacterium]